MNNDYLYHTPSGLGMFCKHGSGSDVQYNTVLAGQQDGEYVESRCPTGTLMVGAYGRAWDALQSIGALCADAGDVFWGTPTTVQEQPTFGLEQPDLAWRRQCPAGMAVKALRARTNYQVSRVELVCQRVDTPEARITIGWRGPSYGEGGYGWVLERCPGREAVGGLRIKTGPGDVVGRLEGQCRRVTRQGTNNVVENGGFFSRVAGHGDAGLDSSVAIHNDTCPAGSLLVGLATGTTNNEITGLGALCADAKAWGNAALDSASVVTPLPQRGSLAGSWNNTTCGRGQYLVGWWITEWNGVKGVSGVCEPFSIN